MSEHQAYLLVRIEAMTPTDHHEAADAAARLAAQTTRRLSWWKRRRSLGHLPHPRHATEAI